MFTFVLFRACSFSIESALVLFRIDFRQVSVLFLRMRVIFLPLPTGNHIDQERHQRKIVNVIRVINNPGDNYDQRQQVRTDEQP